MTQPIDNAAAGRTGASYVALFAFLTVRAFMRYVACLREMPAGLDQAALMLVDLVLLLALSSRRIHLSLVLLGAVAFPFAAGVFNMVLATARPGAEPNLEVALMMVMALGVCGVLLLIGVLAMLARRLSESRSGDWADSVITFEEVEGEPIR